jgi:hypothetical protein
VDNYFATLLPGDPIVPGIIDDYLKQLGKIKNTIFNPSAIVPIDSDSIGKRGAITFIKQVFNP